MQRKKFLLILGLSAFLYGCGGAPETPEERDKRLSTAAAGVPVNCNYEVSSWIYMSPELGTSAILGINYYNFSNTKLEGFPDGEYKIAIDGTYTNRGFVLEQPEEIKYTKVGNNFELKLPSGIRNVSRPLLLTEDQIESWGFQGAVGQKPPRGEFSCVIYDVKFLGQKTN